MNVDEPPTITVSKARQRNQPAWLWMARSVLAASIIHVLPLLTKAKTTRKLQAKKQAPVDQWCTASHLKAPKKEYGFMLLSCHKSEQSPGQQQNVSLNDTDHLPTWAQGNFAAHGCGQVAGQIEKSLDSMTFVLVWMNTAAQQELHVRVANGGAAGSAVTCSGGGVEGWLEKPCLISHGGVLQPIISKLVPHVRVFRLHLELPSAAPWSSAMRRADCSCSMDWRAAARAAACCKRSLSRRVKAW